MPLYTATVDVLVEADDPAQACDVLAEALRPLERKHTPTSHFVDWAYAGTGETLESGVIGAWYRTEGAGFEALEDGTVLLRLASEEAH